MKRIAVFLIALATLAAAAQNVRAQDLPPRELQQRMLERRAIDAAIWGIPIVSLDVMRQAYFRDGKAKYNDIIWWPKGNAWKNQSLTPLPSQVSSCRPRSSVEAVSTSARISTVAANFRAARTIIICMFPRMSP
jgi:hypothetical protein